MVFKKHFAAIPWIEDKGKYYKTKETHHHHHQYSKFIRYILLLLISVSTWFLLLSCFSFSSNYTKPTKNLLPTRTCQGNVSLYVYQLPPEFNLGLLRDCSHLNIYTNMCRHVANHGLGQPLSAATGWFATHQFLAEMIFHGRLENHPCRTLDPTIANLFYIPFYGGLHVSRNFREENHTLRDELAVRLMEYIQIQPWWHRHHGKDHFLVLGRTAWDFMRTDDWPDFGANCLLNLPSVKNISVLTVERQPWQGTNQHGIPYPSYFHPSTAVQMLTWQNKMMRSERLHLFSFIGGPRKGVEKAAIRDELIRQCNKSTRCKLLKCGSNGGSFKCHEPSEVLSVMSQSEFCLQAPGDSFTRRSTFDSVLAGCIPVFFSPHTAYTQYKWYLPADTSEYSVYIDENEIKKENGKRRIVIEEELLKISMDRVQRMRSRIIELMPSLSYAHPNATNAGFSDAVDVAITALAKLSGY